MKAMKNSSTSLAAVQAAAQRRPHLPTLTAYRLFNGFYEGFPGLVLDRYGPALVILDHTPSGLPKGWAEAIAAWGSVNLPGVTAVLLKQRANPDTTWKNGRLLLGSQLPVEIREGSVRYALDLQMNQDAGLYLDTRPLREWLCQHAAGKKVLNTFAYTGSLGVAAGAGGASSVIQTDMNRNFLEIASKSWELNNLNPKHCEILPGDFFRIAGRLRNAERLFDIAVLDPPYFSATEAGKVELEQGSTRLINKIRPLVAHQGWLVVINNALFLSGTDFMAELDALCQSDYLSLETLIPVPEDITGYPETIVSYPPVDPAPFNHPTKIAILRVTRKDRRQ